jgi:DNA-directed RNA polymerase III subunit RPC6
MKKLADKVLGIISKHVHIPDSELSSLLALETSFKDSAKVEAINQLLGAGLIAISEEAEEIVYHSLTKEQAQAVTGLSSEEAVVLQTVRETGSLGIANVEIKGRTGIPTARVNRLLTSLEHKGLVQSVKSVQAKNRKVWLVSEIEPSTEVTGGFLYNTDQEFDNDLLHLLLQSAKQYLQEHTAGVKELTQYLRTVAKGIQEENVKQILTSMTALQDIEELPGGKFRFANWVVPDAVGAPCLACPLKRECHPDGLVSPSSCQYLTDWLGP